jgi:hypothetical protein
MFLVIGCVIALAVAVAVIVGNAHPADQSMTFPTPSPRTFETVPDDSNPAVVPSTVPRTQKAICTPLGTVTDSLRPVMSVHGTRPLTDPQTDAPLGPSVLWISGDTDGGQVGFELFVVAGAKQLGVNDADIAVATAKALSPEDDLEATSPPHTVGSHIEYDITHLRQGRLYVSHVWSHAGVVVLVDVNYVHLADTDPAPAGAAGEWQMMVRSLSFPALDGTPSGDVCPTLRVGQG